MSFLEVSHVRFLMRQRYANALSVNNVLFLQKKIPLGFWSFNEACIVMVFTQGGVLRIPQLED
jgi:hypothetical protein